MNNSRWQDTQAAIAAAKMAKTDLTPVLLEQIAISLAYIADSSVTLRLKK